MTIKCTFAVTVLAEIIIEKLCNYNVKIGGISWMPDLPDEEDVKQHLSNIMATECITERGVNIIFILPQYLTFTDMASYTFIIKDFFVITYRVRYP